MIKIQNILKEENTFQELLESNSYNFLSDSILSLEKNGLTINEVSKIINTIRVNLTNTKYRNRFNEIISKNPDLDFFMKFNVLKCKKKDRIFNKAPLTTAEVERSFSSLNDILKSKRLNMSVKTLSSHLFIYYNKKSS